MGLKRNGAIYLKRLCEINKLNPEFLCYEKPMNTERTNCHYITHRK